MTRAERALRPSSFFGRYEILDCLAESVMSHVYRVRVRFGGRDRILVLKTLHPRLMDDKKTRELFFREIQTCMSLGHANIVQIHDVGEENGSPFIVMEWVHGRNLKQLIAAELNRTKRGLPVALAVYLIEQTARGLHHAHTLKNKVTGELVSVVHRDLSPHNVLVAFDGSVKVIDFGVARPISRESDTLSDQVWGKAGYLSPEQAQGERLDRRSDLFALGAVFWELLSGQKLFQAESVLASAELILEADTYVPKMVARMPGLAEPLVKLLLKCLRANREERYASAEEVARELQTFLRNQPHAVEPAMVAQFVGKLFNDEIDEERALLREYMQGRFRGSVNLGEVDDPSGSTGSGTLTEPTELPELAETDSVAPIRPVPTPVPTPSPSPSPSPAPAQAAAPAEPDRFRLPPDAAVTLAERPPPRGRAEQLEREEQSELEAPPLPAVLPNQVPSKLLLAAAGLATTFALGWHLHRQSLPTSDVTLHLVPSFNAQTELWLDGTPVAAGGSALPGVLLGKSHRLEIHRIHFLPLVKDFRFDQCGQRPQDQCLLELELIPLVYGELTLRTNPEATAHLSDGTATWVHRTPFTRLKLSPGEYQIQMEFDRGTTKTASVSIQKGQASNLFFSADQ